MEDIVKIVDNINDAFRLLNEYIEKFENDPNYKIGNHSISSNDDGKYIVTIKFENVNERKR